jgi:cell division protein FtsX
MLPEMEDVKMDDDAFDRLARDLRFERRVLTAIRVVFWLLTLIVVWVWLFT